MKIIKSIIAIILSLAVVYGFLCIVSEADPWTPVAQIKLFVKGILIITVSVGLMCLIEKREDADDFISR